MRLRKIFLGIVPVTVIFILALVAEAEAQAIGMPLDGGTFEVGYTHRWFKRTVEPDFNEPITWQTSAYFVRYGVAGWMTLSIEGKLSLGHKPDPKYPDRDYREIVFGGEIAATVVSFEDFKVLAVLHYNERFSFDRSIQRYHKQEQSVLAGIGMQHRFVFAPLYVNVIVSPVFVYDELTGYTSRENYTRKSKENVGVTLGLDVVVFDHARYLVNLSSPVFGNQELGPVTFSEHGACC